MRFLFIGVTQGLTFIAPEKIFASGNSYAPHIGLLYIAASLESRGHKVKMLDFYSEEDPEQKIKKDCTSVDAVGISVYTLHLPVARRIARVIKETDKNIPVIIGGPHCTFYPEEALVDVPDADISVEGEGELVIHDIVEMLNGSKDPSQIKGVYYRDNNKIKKGKPSEAIVDLDSLPFPARHLAKKYKYGTVSGMPFHKQKFTTILTTRGCVCRCRFCTRHVTSVKTYRERSVENVIKEIEEINKEYASMLIVDDNFTVNKKRAHKIMDLINQRDIDMEFYINGARVDSAEKILYEKMKKAGVKYICYGIESGNQDVLDFYNKKITIDQIINATRLSKKMGFITAGNFILGAPIETDNHIKKTISFACSLPIDIAFFSVLFYQKGSDLWREAFCQGKITEEDGYLVFPDKKRGLGYFTVGELDRHQQNAFKKFYLRPTYITKQIIKGFERHNTSITRIGLNFFLNRMLKNWIFFA